MYSLIIGVIILIGATRLGFNTDWQFLRSADKIPVEEFKKINKLIQPFVDPEFGKITHNFDILEMWLTLIENNRLQPDIDIGNIRKEVKKFSFSVRRLILSENDLLQRMKFILPKIINFYDKQLSSSVVKVANAIIYPQDEYYPIDNFYTVILSDLLSIQDKLKISRIDCLHTQEEINKLISSLNSEQLTTYENHLNLEKDVFSWLFQWVNGYHNRLKNYQKKIEFIIESREGGHHIKNFIQSVDNLIIDIDHFNEGLREKTLTRRAYYAALSVDSKSIHELIDQLEEMEDFIINKQSDFKEYLKIDNQ